MYIIPQALGKCERWKKNVGGSFLVGTMIMNTSLYALPFSVLPYANEGTSPSSLFDIGNTLYDLHFLPI
jgi:predicted permease